MKIRKAKKFKLRDFREEGFFFEVELAPTISQEGVDPILDLFIDKIEALDLQFCGMFTTSKISGIVVPEKPYSRTTEEGKKAMQTFCLQNIPNCHRASYSPNVDLNHTPDKVWDELEKPTHPSWTHSKPT